MCCSNYCSIAAATMNPLIVSLVIDGGSSFFLPHFDKPPKCINQKELLEIAPYIVINNGKQTAHLYYHFTDYSQDPNFVISVLWLELKKLFARR